MQDNGKTLGLGAGADTAVGEDALVYPAAADGPETSTVSISPDQLASLGEGYVAYVRRFQSEDIKAVIPDAPDMEPGQTMWALISAAGTPIVLADTAQAVLTNAIENNLVTVSVH